VLAALATAVLLAGGYDDGTLLFRFADPRIAESSGLVAGSRSDLLFTHNDSGDVARFFAVDRTGRTRAVYRLRGVQARDWEDVSRGPGRTLWLGDIGDNSASRDRGLLVHRVAEPTLGSPTTLTPTTYRLRYDDGPKDAEALLVTPAGRPLVVEKTLGTSARVYAPDLPLRAGGAVNLMHVVAEVHVPLVTGGDISPDGKRLVLRNYSAAYEWDIPDGDVVGAFKADPARVPLPTTAQGEGVSYSRDGRSLLTSSEGSGAPVYALRRTSGEGPRAAPAPQAGSPAPDTRRGTAGGWRVPLTAAGVVLLIGLVLTAVRHRRS
jgi:WD40 repeat protein